ncbi:MAG: cytochrome c family protein [Myxococcota bacterium]
MIALLACAHPVREPLPVADHAAAEARAAALVPDPARGGPAVASGASPLPPFRGVDRAVAVYVGPEACLACHPVAWRDTAHARAMETLEASRAAFDPACFRCHATGFGHPGGYAGARTPALAAVTCEACHGPGSAHVAAPGSGYGVLPEDGAACVACHTHDNSPDFRFDAYWARVAH